MLILLAESGRSVESLPADLAAAVEEGRIPVYIMKRYLVLENSSFLRWLLQLGGFKERLLADVLFLAKVTIECGIGIFTKVSVKFSISKIRPDFLWSKCHLFENIACCDL